MYLVIVVNRIPYYTMTQVSFGSSFFGLQYHSRDEDGNTVDKKLRVTVRNNRIARHLFRFIFQCTYWSYGAISHMIFYATKIFKLLRLFLYVLFISGGFLCTVVTYM